MAELFLEQVGECMCPDWMTKVGGTSKMGVSHRFSNQAEDLPSAPCFLPCVCGQVHYGALLGLGVETKQVDCSICQGEVVFDMTHVGQLPINTRVVARSRIPCPVMVLDPIQAQLEMVSGIEIGQKKTWRVTAGEHQVISGEQMIGVFDVQGHLLHLGYYHGGQLVRGVYLHQESGFIQYRSRRSLITYERGLVEGPLMPAFYGSQSIAIVHRNYRVWRRRMLRRVISAAAIQSRDRISLYPH